VNVSSKADGHNRQDLSDFSRAFGRTANISKVDSNYLTAIIQICTTVESFVSAVLEVLANFRSEVILVVKIFNRV
jgi:hypothetical protein